MARVSGLVSGLDTDALIQELVSAYQKKQDTYVKKQKKLEWTQEIWKGLNTKVYNFYTGALRKARFSSAYNLKKATVSDSTKATVTADSSAVVGTQTLEVKELATTAYLTGGKLQRKKKADGTTDDTTTKLTGNSKMKELGFGGSGENGSIKVNVNGKETELSVNGETTINQFVVQLKEAGLSANFDDTNQRLFVSASGSGKDKEFSITAADSNGLEVLKTLGLNAPSSSDVRKYIDKAYMNVDENAGTAYVRDVLTRANAKLSSELSVLQDQYKYVTDANYKTEKDAAWDKQGETIQSNMAKLNLLVDSTTDGDGKITSTSPKTIVTQKDDGTYVFDSSILETLADSDGNLNEEAIKNASNDDLIVKFGNLDEYKDDENNIDKDKLISDLNRQLESLNKYTKEQDNLKNTRDKYTTEFNKSEADASSGDDKGTGLNNRITQTKQEIDRNTKLMSQKFDFSNAQSTDTISYTSMDGKTTETIDYNTLVSQLNKYENVTVSGTTYADQIAELKNTDNYKAKQTKFENEKTEARNYLQSDLKLTLPTNKENITDEMINKAVSDAAEEAKKSSNSAVRVEGQDAEIILNGATFNSTTNNFSINGLTITATGKTEGQQITISTTADIDGMYDSIKSLIGGFNDILKEMNTLYYADSSKGYEPLSDEEKDAMSDTEVEKWEKKIKDSLLRRDSTLSGIMGTIKNSMAKSFQINGKSYSLSSFGINTSGYFAVDNESRGLYHIDGDKDDTSTSGNTDKLRAALASDPDTVISFFQKLSDDMYTQLTKKMSATSLRSSYTIYNDKQLKKQYEEYDDIIDEWDDKIEKYTQKYVKQFTAMETALAKLQSSTSALSSLIG